jgi:hypothetical protein
MDEYFRRNGRRVVLHEVPGGQHWGLTSAEEPYDAFDDRELREIADTAWTYAKTVSGVKPNYDLFAAIPLAKNERNAYQAVPWWKRFWAEEPAFPAGANLDLIELDEVRRINEQLKGLPDDNAVDLDHISTGFDLERVASSAVPVTSDQLRRFQEAGIVSGGGRGSTGLPPTQSYRHPHGLVSLYDLLVQYLRGTPGTVEQDLQIAIVQRNRAIDKGAAKSLIASWNAEIAYLSRMARNHPSF